MPGRGPYLIGVSLKMYFGHARTLEWCRQVGDIARAHPAIRTGTARLFVIPSYPAIPEARAILAGVAEIGAQDLADHDAGPYTGEVSGVELAEIGCTLAEVGHAERRALFGETDRVVAAKTAAALRNRLTPVICVGETDRTDSDTAARSCVRSLDRALRDTPADDADRPVIAAYEPRWAIGAADPAPAEHIRTVCTALRGRLDDRHHGDHAVLYGGSAGPGTLTRIADSADGLFLGRRAHDPRALTAVLDEVAAITR